MLIAPDIHICNRVVLDELNNVLLTDEKEVALATIPAFAIMCQFDPVMEVVRSLENVLLWVVSFSLN